MKKIFVILTLLISLHLGAQPTVEMTVPKVKIESGIIKGVQEGEVESFKGIPYAAPPVGEFRWRPPQPVTSWKGELDATKYGSNCAQSGWGGTPGSIVEGSSEDCLYLNLWKPTNVKSNAKLPVMVWIHGGGFVGGSGSGPGLKVVSPIWLLQAISEPNGWKKLLMTIL